MSRVKKIAAAVIAVCLCLSCMAALSSCRTKDETVITFHNGDKTYEMKAGVYLCNLVAAYSDFRNEFGEQAEQASMTTAAGFKYEDQTLENKNYTDWISERCQKLAALFAFVETECERLGIKLTDEENSYVDQYASAYWATGSSTVYELNGVSYESYRKYFANQQFKLQKLFDYYYGVHTDEEKAKNSELGSLRPSDDEIGKFLSENYVIADVLQTQFTSTDSSTNQSVTLTDEQKKDAKAKLQKMADRFNAGTAFSVLYNEVHNTTEVPNSQYEMKDKYAEVFSSDKTNSASTYFADIQKQPLGKAVVLEFNDSYMMVVKQDITKDKFYFDNYSETIVNTMEYKDFYDKKLEDAQGMKTERNESAIRFYHPGRVKMPSAS
ncbi:MAG: hypothetical protein ACI4IV_04730 [Acutalibacteraceae bacterium]